MCTQAMLLTLQELISQQIQPSIHAGYQTLNKFALKGVLQRCYMLYQYL